jgi:alanine racemase
MPKVTINDIAREAGVSKTAVSFAFNDPNQLASTTVQHIRKVAELLGYSPDPIARSMTTKRTNTIGLLLPHDIAAALANPFYTQFTRGVGRVCSNEGLTLLLVPPLWGSRLKAIPSAAVDGFVVVGLDMERGEVQSLQRRGVPFVIVDSQAPEDVTSVNIDNRSGARAIMEHVLSRGHQRISIIALEGTAVNSGMGSATVVDRMAGYREALALHGIPADSADIQIIDAPSSWEGGRRAFDRVWESHRPTAVVAMSDIIAIGVIEAARSCRVRVPEQLSVVGFDDLPDTRYVRPALTTVRQPVEEKGRLAAEMLVAALRGDKATASRTLPTELVVRRSVAYAKELVNGFNGNGYAHSNGNGHTSNGYHYSNGDTYHYGNGDGLHLSNGD